MADAQKIGLIGLGTMGSALALNLAEKGAHVVVQNRTEARVPEFISEAGALASNLEGAGDLADLVARLPEPRFIILMTPAGSATDAMIDDLKPLLSAGDTLIDAGNSDFHDTRRRTEQLEEAGFKFLGMGVSGGEEGARHGPSIMVGGTADAYAPVKGIIEAIAAKFEGAPCAAHLGPDGAGHFVKTVHNGIEYADMQMIAEVYGLLCDAGWDAPKIGALFGEWGKGNLGSYLVEVTEAVLLATDPETGKPIVDVIMDKAGQKGTGRWTVIEALKLGQSATTIEAAVAARSWSAEPAVRAAGEVALDPAGLEKVDVSAEDLKEAFLAARILAYAQGFRVLQAASETYVWDLDMARVAEIWRAGCIIRSVLLDEISSAHRAGLPEGQLYLAEGLRQKVIAGLPALRRVVSGAALSGRPVPALASALSFIDTMRLGRGTTNLIQAQRDYFGAHGFERVDSDATGLHGPWAGHGM
ncbi:MAG: NADP-dependent phosphogluconate dehydrogenase [Pseudomonadota bacterium]|nr:NADP-dependent phosphogluconate dehydrogenase [Pseudomonadota bacterium]